MLNNSHDFENIGITLKKNKFPTLIIKLQNTKYPQLLLHIEADNYDYLPIRGWWVDDRDNPLKQGMPKNNGFHTTSNPHCEDKCWFCFPGWREYHDHSSHQDITWNTIRHESKYKIPGLIHDLHIALSKM